MHTTIAVLLGVLGFSPAAGKEVVNLENIQCPAGGKHATQSYVPIRANGCGPQGLGFGRFFKHVIDTDRNSATKCCNVHDTCYSICGMERSVCEEEMSACLEEVEANSETKVSRWYWRNTKRLMIKAITTFGTKYFNRAQSGGCECVSSDVDDKARYALHAHNFTTPEEFADLTQGEMTASDLGNELWGLVLGNRGKIQQHQGKGAFTKAKGKAVKIVKAVTHTVTTAVKSIAKAITGWFSSW